jgi:hypothetical protein
MPSASPPRETDVTLLAENYRRPSQYPVFRLKREEALVGFDRGHTVSPAAWCWGHRYRSWNTVFKHFYTPAARGRDRRGSSPRCIHIHHGQSVSDLGRNPKKRSLYGPDFHLFRLTGRRGAAAVTGPARPSRPAKCQTAADPRVGAPETPDTPTPLPFPTLRCLYASPTRCFQHHHHRLTWR